MNANKKNIIEKVRVLNKKINHMDTLPADDIMEVLVAYKELADSQSFYISLLESSLSELRE